MIVPRRWRRLTKWQPGRHHRPGTNWGQRKLLSTTVLISTVSRWPAN